MENTTAELMLSSIEMKEINLSSGNQSFNGFESVNHLKSSPCLHEKVQSSAAHWSHFEFYNRKKLFQFCSVVTLIREILIQPSYLDCLFMHIEILLLAVFAIAIDGSETKTLTNESFHV